MKKIPPELITSFKNPKVQTVRELLSSRKSRQDQQACVVEGIRLAEEAVASGVKLHYAFFSEGISHRGLELVDVIQNQNVPCYKVPDDLMSRISATEADQGLLLVLEPQKDALPKTVDFVLVLDEIKDPGNMGTILRTARAAGVQLVIITPGCVDVYSPKVLRAGMGAHFSLPICTLNWDEIMQYWISQSGSPGLFLAESTQGECIWQMDLTKPLGLIIGGEADGASETARQYATRVVNIPMPGGSESLNAAVAAGIFMFEVARQRSE
jgi:TrmH family RNA methyltransferase